MEASIILVAGGILMGLGAIGSGVGIGILSGKYLSLIHISEPTRPY